MYQSVLVYRGAKKGNAVVPVGTIVIFMFILREPLLKTGKLFGYMTQTCCLLIHVLVLGRLSPIFTFLQGQKI